jgi:hypothetical protein
MMPIAMNLSSEKKHNMKSLLTVISLALTLVSPAFAGIDWGFDTSANPAYASGGAGNAAISVGAFGTGWHDGTTIPWNTLGGAKGFWDLGNAGSIILSGMTLSGGPITLDVFQWVHPGTYIGDLTVAASNGSATLLGSSLIGSLDNGGGWYDFAYSLSAALTPTDSVTITAGAGGAVIDRLTLVPEPATYIAGAMLLIPFAWSMWPLLRRRK